MDLKLVFFRGIPSKSGVTLNLLRTEISQAHQIQNVVMQNGREAVACHPPPTPSHGVRQNPRAGSHVGKGGGNKVNRVGVGGRFSGTVCAVSVYWDVPDLTRQTSQLRAVVYRFYQHYSILTSPRTSGLDRPYPHPPRKLP